MAGDPFKHVTSGDPFEPSADVWNGFLDTTKAFKRQRFGQGAVGPQLTSPTSVAVRLLNDTGNDVAEGAVLGIGGPLWTPTQAPDSFADEVMIRGVTPAEEHIGAYVITTGPIPANSDILGRGVLVGAIWTQVLINAASHTFADVRPGETHLQSSFGGSARILYKESGTGLRNAIVLLGHESLAVIVGKTQSPITKGSNGGVYIYDENDEPTGDSINAKNMFVNLTADKWVIAIKIGTQWYLVAGECS